MALSSLSTAAHGGSGRTLERARADRATTLSSPRSARGRGRLQTCFHQESRPHALKATDSEVLVHPDRAAVLAEQSALKGAGWNRPLMQVRPTHAKRVIEILIRTCPVSVERDDEALDANSCGAKAVYCRTVKLDLQSERTRPHENHPSNTNFAPRATRVWYRGSGTIPCRLLGGPTVAITMVTEAGRGMNRCGRLFDSYDRFDNDSCR